MLLMRKKLTSPPLSLKSAFSPQLSLRSVGSPSSSLCPPTPQWDSLPSLSSAQNSSFEAQIAWTAYQGCSRRMNGACAANRVQQSWEDQRSWWEETSSICRNAIMLHSATLHKQYDPETARNLELLEHAYHVVQTMLDTLASQRQWPLVEDISESKPQPGSLSSASTLVEAPLKRSRSSGFSAMFGKFRNRMATREPQFETVTIRDADTSLY